MKDKIENDSSRIYCFCKKLISSEESSFFMEIILDKKPPKTYYFRFFFVFVTINQISGKNIYLTQIKILN